MTAATPWTRRRSRSRCTTSRRIWSTSPPRPTLPASSPTSISSTTPFWRKPNATGGGAGVGLLFVYTGNEGDIDWFASNIGFMFDIAPEFWSLLVFIKITLKELPTSWSQACLSKYMCTLYVCFRFRWSWFSSYFSSLCG